MHRCARLRFTLKLSKYRQVLSRIESTKHSLEYELCYALLPFHLFPVCSSSSGSSSSGSGRQMEAGLLLRGLLLVEIKTRQVRLSRRSGLSQQPAG